MVLDDDQIVSYLHIETYPSLKSYFQAEFDSPKTTPKDKWVLEVIGALVDGSGDKNALYAIADGKRIQLFVRRSHCIQSMLYISMDIVAWGCACSLI